MTHVKNQLGQRLKELRGERTLYQVEMESGINRSQLKRYEAGRIPEDTILEKLAAYYGISYEVLKALSFEDLYPKGSKERKALLAWVKSL